MLEHIFNLLLRLSELERTQFVNRPVDRRCIILQFNFELMSHPDRRNPTWQIGRKDVLEFIQDILNQLGHV